MIGGVFVLSRIALPHVMRWVVATRSSEVFLLAVLGICVGTAALAELSGLSLALGAFLAGVVLAGTQYGGRAVADVLPFRNLLATVFFVSLGMLFDPRWILERPWTVGFLLVAFLVGKGLFATVAALAMRFPPRVAWLAGVGLAQFGEFGWVLVQLGEKHGLLAPSDSGPLLAAGLLSMVLTPLALRIAPHFAAGERILRPLARLLGAPSTADLGPEESELSGHVVLVGFGVAGRLLSRALKETGIPYLVLELNADTVRRARADGEPIFYGDVTSPEALTHASLERARALVLLVNDPDAAMRAVRAARAFAPDVPILLRSRYLADRPPLRALGATDVVLEEVEGGTEMIARLLRRLGVPGNLIADRVRSARAAVEHDVRDGSLPPRRLGETADLDALRIETFHVSNGAHAAGRTLAGLRLRTRTGTLVVAKRTGGRLVENPDPDEVLAPGDTLFLIGTPDQIRRGLELLDRGPTPEPEAVA
jgi:CPA2 family monovalent cation:H+ antiporter-2